MITSELETTALSFDHDTHIYRFNGAVVPNVTRVLEEEGLVDFSGVPEATLRDSQWRGSAVHHACLLDDEGDLDESTVEPEHRGYLEAWRRVKANLKPRIVSEEHRAFDPLYKYAGTWDRLVELPSRSRLQLWDLKTGVPQKSARLQTAAYAHLMCIPSAVDRFIVRLTREGNYTMQEHPLRDLADDFALFRAALMLNRFKRGNL